MCFAVATIIVSDIRDLEKSESSHHVATAVDLVVNHTTTWTLLPGSSLHELHVRFAYFRRAFLCCRIVELLQLSAVRTSLNLTLHAHEVVDAFCFELCAA
jgi:hypothetical protein